MLDVVSVSKSFGAIHAVNDVSFSVQKGQCYGLLGPNGAGKTTTISIIAGTMDADKGQVLIGGKPISIRNVDAKRQIGYVPQELAVYGDLSARDNLSFFGSLYGLTGSNLSRAVDSALELAGLTDRASDLVKTYSGGMKRRVNIAVGVLHDPELLIFDEPTVGVDPQSRNAIFEAIEGLAKRGKTILYTTHYMEEVERLCSRVAVMDNGKVIADDDLSGLHRLIPQRNEVTLELANPLDERQLAAVGSGASQDGKTVHLTVSSLSSDLPPLLDTLKSQGARIESISSYKPSLEEVFLHLTGKGLRD